MRFNLDLTSLRPALAGAAERFGRDVRRSQRAARRSRSRRVSFWRPLRHPFPRAGRPVMRRVALPRPMRIRQPLTVLERRRILDANLRGGRPAIVEAVEGGAQRVAETLRLGLLALRRRLRDVYRRGRLTSQLATAATRRRSWRGGR
jgi:hypothetical protein